MGTVLIIAAGRNKISKAAYRVVSEYPVHLIYQSSPAGLLLSLILAHLPAVSIIRSVVNL